jgi:hypothetical protein
MQPKKKKAKTLKHVGITYNFLNRTPVAQQLRERIDKWNCTKLKVFCTTKETAIRLKKQPTEWGKNLCQLYI